MKPLLKKINRGVILSLLVILALVGYYVTIGIINRGVNEELSKLCQSYLSVKQELALLPEEYRGGKTPVPEEVMKQRQEERAQKLTPLFTSGSKEAVDKTASLLESNMVSSTSLEISGVGRVDYFSVLEEASYRFKKVMNSSIQQDTATAIFSYEINEKNNNDGYVHQWKGVNQIKATFEKVDGKWLLTGIIDPYYAD